MIRKFYKLSQGKKIELYNIQSELDSIRHRLDNVMYSGDTPDETVSDLRKVYDHICKAIDQF